MKGRQIRESLHNGRRIYSTCVTALSPRVPEFLRQAKVDFAFIDTEHTPLGREALSWMCQTYSAMGIPPVVRIPSPDPIEATKAIDGGAGGIIGPYIETAEQVQALIGAVRWRPLKGRRLQEALRNPATVEPELRSYLESRNQDILLILNIESVPAIENLDALLATPGVDAVLIGPHDLSCSLGLPEQYRHARFEEAVQTVFRKARESHVGAGFHFWEDIEREVSWAQSGANLIIHSADITFIRNNLKRDLDRIRETLGDNPPSDDAGGSAIV